MSGCVVQQARPVDVVKKDDDLWSPRHSSSHSQPFFTGLGSESAFLSHFLPAPGNHPSSTVSQFSSTALRADLQRSKHAGEATPHQRPCDGIPQPAATHIVLSTSSGSGVAVYAFAAKDESYNALQVCLPSCCIGQPRHQTRSKASCILKACTETAQLLHLAAYTRPGHMESSACLQSLRAQSPSPYLHTVVATLWSHSR